MNKRAPKSSTKFLMKKLKAETFILTYSHVRVDPINYSLKLLEITFR